MQNFCVSNAKIWHQYPIITLIVSSSTIDIFYQIYTFYQNRYQIYIFYQNSYQIYIFYENRYQIYTKFRYQNRYQIS